IRLAADMTFPAALAASCRREMAYVRRSGWDLCLLFIVPCVAIIVLAATFYAGVFRHVPVAVVDADHSALSRAIRHNLHATPKLRVAHTPADLSAARHLA